MLLHPMTFIVYLPPHWKANQIVLGVSETSGHRFTVTGVTNPEKMCAEFWTTVRNSQKIERDVLLSDSVKVVTVNGVKVIIINVPRAERGDKPVRIKTRREKQFIAWIRRGSSDVKATPGDLRLLDYDNARRADRLPLDGFSIDSFNSSTIKRYRSIFMSRKPSSPWNTDSEEDFLYHIGALTRGREGKIQATQAGLLAFGHEYEITNYLPHFFLDYRQQTAGNPRWEDRIVSQDGEWSGNLIDFYYEVTNRLIRFFKAPFTTDETGTVHGVGNPLTESVNEAIANAIIHAYYGEKSSITIVVDDDSLTVTNPGSFLIDRDVAIAGGITEQRNPTLMRIFGFVGVCDRAGSGVQKIFDTWLNEYGLTPCLTEEHSPAVVRLALPLPKDAPSQTGTVPNRRGATLDDNKLYAFIEGSVDGVSSIEVSRAFGVSRRVAQKHLAALYSDPRNNVSRSESTTPYVYFVDTISTD